MGAVWENPAAAAVPGKYRWCLNMAVQYKRILLKVSGEALSGEKGTGFDEATIASICAGIKAAYDLGAQIGIVVGGGNFWRGRSSGTGVFWLKLFSIVNHHFLFCLLNHCQAIGRRCF